MEREHLPGVQGIEEGAYPHGVHGVLGLHGDPLRIPARLQQESGKSGEDDHRE